MKNFSSFLGIFLVIGLFTGCTKEDSNPGVDDNLLSYDGNNITGPLLVAGNYEAAAQFFASDLAKVSGKKLAQVRWFMGIAPAKTVIKIYTGGNGNSPGNLAFEKDVTDRLETPGWNTYRLTTPIEITDQDIWISIAFTHSNTQQSIGCDAGPSATGGDWLFFAQDNSWKPYNERTPESINWNIRGLLE